MARSKRDGIAELHARRDDRNRRSGGRSWRTAWLEWLAQTQAQGATLDIDTQEALQEGFEAGWKAATGHESVDDVHPGNAQEEA